MPAAKKHISSFISDDLIINKIYLLRGIKVMLDRDLAEMYGVETKVFKQAVKRNLERFPSDFMFTLTKEEFQTLRSQFVTSNKGRCAQDTCRLHLLNKAFHVINHFKQRNCLPG